jgi:hypothetical protein
MVKNLRKQLFLPQIPWKTPIKFISISRIGATSEQALPIVAFCSEKRKEKFKGKKKI